MVSFCHQCHQASILLKIKDNKCKACRKKDAIHPLQEKLLLVWFKVVGGRQVPQFHQPKVIADLTLAELMCIQMASPFVPQQYINKGTFGLKGHVCCFPQDITEIYTVLPRLPSQIKIVKLVRCVISTVGGGVSDKTFSVNRQQVLDALYWLKEHNALYRDVTVKEENLDWMGENQTASLGHEFASNTSKDDNEIFDVRLL